SGRRFCPTVEPLEERTVLSIALFGVPTWVAQAVGSSRLELLKNSWRDLPRNGGLFYEGTAPLGSKGSGTEFRAFYQRASPAGRRLVFGPGANRGPGRRPLYRLERSYHVPHHGR